VPFRLTLQFALAILLYFSLFALTTFRSIATPIALKDIAGANVTAVTGVTFALGGVASAMGVWMLSARFFRNRRLRTMLAIICVLAALAHLLLALGNSVWLYVLAFTLASFLNASMMPATNTMIATSAANGAGPLSASQRRQAVAFMAGPMGAAMFATVSLKAGFATVSILLPPRRPWSPSPCASRRWTNRQDLHGLELAAEDMAGNRRSTSAGRFRCPSAGSLGTRLHRNVVVDT
jgi:MFS family permease